MDGKAYTWQGHEHPISNQRAPSTVEHPAFSSPPRESTSCEGWSLLGGSGGDWLNQVGGYLAIEAVSLPAYGIGVTGGANGSVKVWDLAGFSILREFLCLGEGGVSLLEADSQFIVWTNAITAGVEVVQFDATGSDAPRYGMCRRQSYRY